MRGVSEKRERREREEREKREREEREKKEREERASERGREGARKRASEIAREIEGASETASAREGCVRRGANPSIHGGTQVGPRRVIH